MAKWVFKKRPFLFLTALSAPRWQITGCPWTCTLEGRNMLSCTYSMRDSSAIFATIKKWSGTGEHLSLFAKEFGSLNDSSTQVAVLAEQGKYMWQMTPGFKYTSEVTLSLSHLKSHFCCFVSLLACDVAHSHRILPSAPVCLAELSNQGFYLRGREKRFIMVCGFSQRLVGGGVYHLATVCVSSFSTPD